MTDPWEAVKTATMVVGTGVGAIVAFGAVIGSAALLGHMAEHRLGWMPLWAVCAVVGLGGAAVMWLIVFLDTLFFGMAR